MVRLTIRTKKKPDEVSDRIVAYFGEGGLGLDELTEGHIHRFTGGGGHVVATVHQDDAETVIDIETREFDEQVRRFARELG